MIPHRSRRYSTVLHFHRSLSGGRQRRETRKYVGCSCCCVALVVQQQEHSVEHRSCRGRKQASTTSKMRLLFMAAACRECPCRCRLYPRFFQAFLRFVLRSACTNRPCNFLLCYLRARFCHLFPGRTVDIHGGWHLGRCAACLHIAALLCPSLRN